MKWWPNHHPACFCWVCRGQKKPGHPSDRYKCGRCLREATSHQLENSVPQCISVADWDAMLPHITALQSAGYYISPVGEIEGDVYVEMEEEAVALWKELTSGGLSVSSL